MNFSNFRRTTLALAASAGVLLVAGCRKSNSQSHDADSEHHDREEKTVQVTQWTEEHELFVEYNLPTVGKPVQFITHVSEWKSQTPRPEGAITFEYGQAGGQKESRTFNQPTRPGVYKAELKFPKKGEWKVTVFVPGIEGDSKFELPVIRVYASEHDATYGEGIEGPEGVSFLKEQQWSLKTKAEPAAKRRMVERLSILGQTRPKPGMFARVMAPLAGEIIPPQGKNLPLPGTKVQPAEVLALLRPAFSEVAARFVELEADFGIAKADYTQAQAAFDRTKKLVAAEAKSPREFEEAANALNSAHARLEALSALRNAYASGTNGLTALELRAPIGGSITRTLLGDGVTTGPNEEVFSILNTEWIWIEGRAPESEAGKMRGNANAFCEVLDESRRMFNIGELGGKLIYIDQEIDSETRTFGVIYEINNKDAGLRLGQAVRLHVETKEIQESLAIPDSALIEEGGLYVAYVQLAGETFERRELRLGIRDGEWVQVLSGLAEGDRVVTQGAYYIRLASVSGVIPEHGHEH